jgi:hypothetical protein
VGLSAVAISMRLTLGAIITAGIDCSFTLDSYHARSTPGHLAALRRQNRFKGLFNTEAVFGQPVFNALSKTGNKVLSNPGMRNYRNLFETQFGTSSSRLFDITGSGLPLGIKTLSMEKAFGVLTSSNSMVNECDNSMNILFTKENTNLSTGNDQAVYKNYTKKMRGFIHEEVDRLTLLRSILIGEAPMDYSILAGLIDECDYLWAHFPDYAASSRRPDKAELETGGKAVVLFLNRLRAEIDPFLRLWGHTKEQIAGSK